MFIPPATARNDDDDDDDDDVVWVHSPSPSPSPSPLPPSSSDLDMSSFHRTVPPAAIALSSPTSSSSSAAFALFAIGSMMNATAIALRGVGAVGLSAPAVLRGYTLVFRGVNGMADIQESEDATAAFHGVVHYIGARDVMILDRIEAGYHRRKVDVVLYDGRTVRADVYEMDFPKPRTNVPPSARYLRILTDGAESFGVCPEYVSALRRVICRPRTSRLARLTLPPSPVRLRMTAAELADCNGKDGRPLLLAVNGKILRYDGKLTAANGDDDAPTNIVEQLQREYGGADITHRLALHCYDPDFPLPQSLATMSKRHRRAVEDMVKQRTCCLATFNFTAVGVLVDGDTGAGAAAAAAAADEADSDSADDE